MAHRVLLIDQDADVRVLLAESFRQAGYAVMMASTARAGLELARSTVPDLIVSELVLPDLPGAQLIQTLKSDARTLHVPIVVLTERAAEADRVFGLELGADEYITKPFSVRELHLRARLVLRRAGSVPTKANRTLVVGAVQILGESREVRVEGALLHLTPIEFRLLATLAHRAGQVQSREVLLADVWDAAPNLETRTVDAHVKRLRVKLGTAGRQISTVRGVGYRFVDRT